VAPIAPATTGTASVYAMRWVSSGLPSLPIAAAFAAFTPKSSTPPPNSRSVPRFQPTERTLSIARSLAVRFQNRLS
jgi:hypothetical protein